jgi:hypothetical protein
MKEYSYYETLIYDILFLILGMRLEDLRCKEKIMKVPPLSILNNYLFLLFYKAAPLST